MSLVQGGSANIPLRHHSGTISAPTTPIIADTSLGSAPTWITMLVDYTLSSDGGALSRPGAHILASYTFPLTLAAGTRIELGRAEAEALIAAGAARLS